MTADQGIVILYISAASLELAGLVLTGVALLDAQRRLKEFLSKSTTIVVQAVAAFAGVGAVEAGGVGEPLTIEQRVARLEAWRDIGHPADHEQLHTHIDTRVQAAATAVSAELNEGMKRLNKVIGGPQWWWWLGPLLLALGVILGSAGNLWALSSPR